MRIQAEASTESSANWKKRGFIARITPYDKRTKNALCRIIQTQTQTRKALQLVLITRLPWPALALYPWHTPNTATNRKGY